MRNTIGTNQTPLSQYVIPESSLGGLNSRPSLMVSCIEIS